jgi:hypothetical protein
MGNSTTRKKRRPGTAGTATGAKQNRKSQSQRKNSQARSQKQGLEHRSFAIYSGREALGTVEQIGRKFTAYTINPGSRRISAHKTLKAAADALSRARRHDTQQGALSDG